MTGTAAQNSSRNEIPMNCKFQSVVGAAMLVLGTMSAHADATIDKYVTFSGFGTLGEVYSDYRQADFTGEYLPTSGAGFSRRWSPTPDSDLAGQADVRIADGLTGVVQVLSRQTDHGNFAPRVEWA